MAESLPTESEALRTGQVLLQRVLDARNSPRPAEPLYQDGRSFGTYYNAFPASYWRHWTTIDRVELRVRAASPGVLSVFRSDADGATTPIAARSLATNELFEMAIPLDDFGDGGWLWFDFDAEDGAAAPIEAGWWAPADAARARSIRASIAVTTLHRERYVLALLERLAADPDVMRAIDRVIVIDHGSRRVRDAPGFDAAATALGEQLAVIEQPNLGGSGGFSRGMLESLAGGSDAVILLDDDIALEPDGLRRLIRFAEFATEPLVVGGHMLDLNRPTRLHAFSEGFRMEPFFWTAIGPIGHDFAESSLRASPWLHRRASADYNGWWMCLIPSEVLRKVGLAMPYFIKWDDAEFGLRAGEAGFSTVTLPGAAVWHVSWTDKDDTVDWQAYFHARNRLITALLHSPRPRGGRAIVADLAVSFKLLLALEYGAQALRNAAIHDVLAGPAGLHESLATAIGEVRSTLEAHPSGVTLQAAEWATASAQIPVHMPTERALRRPSGIGNAFAAVPGFLRNLAPRLRSRTEAQAVLRAPHARWWIVSRFDSVLVESAAGGSGRWLRRERRTFWTLLREALRLSRELRREWPRLAATYRAALPELTSSDRWRATTGG